MKKSKIWIHVCVHFLLYITLGVPSSTLDISPVTDDTSRLPVLKANIPKDYKIPVHYIPKNVGGMCFVTLNVFYLEKSLDDLADKFGNISSNRKDISIFIQMLQELRINMGSLDEVMMDYECHYRQEKWQTGRYFEFVEDFFKAARNTTPSPPCDPPSCPTPTTPAVTEAGPPTGPPNTTLPCQRDCDTLPEPRMLSEMMERSLFSLLLIPLVALVFLLVWKVRSRSHEQDLQQNPEEGGIAATAPPLDAEISEKSMLNTIEIV